MGDILLRNVASDIDRKLRESARRNHRSLSDEAQVWLRRTITPVPPPSGRSLVERLREGLDDDDFIDLVIPRTPDRAPPDFS